MRTKVTNLDIESPGESAGKAFITDGSGEVIISGVPFLGHHHVESEVTDIVHDAVKLRTRDISTTAPTDGQTYRWDSGASEWVPSGVVADDEKIGEIQQAGVSKATAVSIMNFKGTAVNEVTDQGGGKVDIDLSASGTGASEFTGLTDTPSSYTGEGGQAVIVKGTEDGLEFGTAGGGANLEIKDEGTILTPSGTSIDFVGDAVTATIDGTKATVSIPGLLVDVPEFIGTRILLKTDTQVNTGDFWTDINWENNGVEVYAEPSSFIFAGGDLRVPEVGYYLITFQETISGSPLPTDANRNFAPHLDFNNVAIAIDQGIRVTTDLQSFDVTTAYFFNSTTTNIRVVTFNEGHNESIYPTMVSGYFTHITIHKIAPSTLGIRAVRTVQLDTITITTGTDTDVEWESDNGAGGGYDTDNFWSTSNRSEFTIPASGYYSIQAQITWDRFGGGTDRRFWAEVNGSNIIVEANTKHPGPASTNSLQQVIATSYFFNEGDTIKFRVWHDRGENLNILTGNIFGSEANANITQVGRP